MSDAVAAPEGEGSPDEGFDAIVGLNEGFLGTGHSSAVELSYVAMALIAAYVAFSMVRYFLPDFRITDRILRALGFRDE